MDGERDDGPGAGGARKATPAEVGRRGPRGPQPCSVCGEPGHKAPTCGRRPRDDRANPLVAAPAPAPGAGKGAPEPAPPADAETLRRALEPIFVLAEEALEPAIVELGGKPFPRARLDGQEVRVVARLNASLWSDALVAWQVPADKYVLLLAAAGTTATMYGVPAYAIVRERHARKAQGKPGTVRVPVDPERAAHRETTT